MLKETPYTTFDMRIIERLCLNDIAESQPKFFNDTKDHICTLQEVALLYCKSVGVIPKCNPAYMRVSVKAKILGLLMLYDSNDVTCNQRITDRLLSLVPDKLKWLKWYDGTDRPAYDHLLIMMIDNELELW